MSTTNDELIASPAARVPQQKTKLPLSAHLPCGWPLLLVSIGGALGGGLGGAAYGVNVAILQVAAFAGGGDGTVAGYRIAKADSYGRQATCGEMLA